MKLPSEVTLAVRKRQLRKIIRRNPYTPPLRGAYDVASRDRRHEELAAIAAKC